MVSTGGDPCKGFRWKGFPCKGSPEDVPWKVPLEDVAWGGSLVSVSWKWSPGGGHLGKSLKGVP